MENPNQPTLFLGPKGEFAPVFAGLWTQLFEDVVKRRQRIFANDPSWSGHVAVAQQPLRGGLDALLEILETEIPTFSPHYLGHMISDISIPALLGHMAVLFENPNLASREAASAGSQLEVQAVNALAEMIGLPLPPVRGHFTSGGTVANFEAFWRARYRLDHWLALGAWLVEHGRTPADFFALAHMGWSAFDEHLEVQAIDEQQLRERSWVLRGPWAISRYYRTVLGNEFPEPVLLVPGNKHYSWPKSANVFGLSEDAIWPLDLDACGRVRIDALEAAIDRARGLGRPILMVVSVAGTTELGMIDPVDQVAARLARYRDEDGLHIWHHVDAAYGGYLCTTFKEGESALDAPAVAALEGLKKVDSITLDPHKLGFVPYACGAFIAPNPRAYAVSSIRAPYLAQDTEAAYPSWSTTLEGSRAATGAGAVWLSAKILPLDASGHGALLNESIKTTRLFYQAISERIANVRMVPVSDSNIVCFTLAREGASLSEANAAAGQLVDRFKEHPDFACTRTALGLDSYRALIEGMLQTWNGELDSDHMLVVRMVIMNPYMNEASATSALLDQLLLAITEMVDTA